MYDITFWLEFATAVPAGVAGALIGERLIDYLRPSPSTRQKDHR